MDVNWCTGWNDIIRFGDRAVPAKGQYASNNKKINLAFCMHGQILRKEGLIWVGGIAKK
jgi:hypothetical protein